MTRLVWFGALAAPTAWALQHVSGYFLSEAHCDEARLVVSFDPIAVAITAAAALVTVAGGLAALRAFRAERHTEEWADPPAGRVKFLAVIGLTITPLFLALILMNGVGAVLLGCRLS